MSDHGGSLTIVPPAAPAQAEAPRAATDEKPRRKFRFPTAFTVLAIVLPLVWIAAFVDLVTPTSAAIMGGLALSKIGYDRYLEFFRPFRAVVLVVCCAFIGVSAAAS